MGTFPQDHGTVPPARRNSAEATSLVGFVAACTLDAELGALVWLMADAHVPLVVACAEPAGPAADLLGSFVNLLGPGTIRLELRGEAETFDWIGDAASLGWPGDEPVPGPTSGFELHLARALALPPRRVAPPETTFLLAGELGAQRPATTWGARARTTVRALQRGYGMGAVIRAGSLEQVFVELAEPPASLGADELRRLGVVLVLHRADGASGPHRIRAQGGRSPRELAAPPADSDALRAADPSRWRVAACHYVRPLERDGAGHVQRRPPAILATWDPTRDAFEHFAWGVTAELAMRVGLPRDEFEREHTARTRLISALLDAGRTSTEELQAALAERAGPGRGGEA